jgi:hypothetical protein
MSQPKTPTPIPTKRLVHVNGGWAAPHWNQTPEGWRWGWAQK